jgi:catechol 2,3-dioxygenase-like lactoylglutathione lyase family enzyme
MSLYIGSIVINVSDIKRSRDFWTAALHYVVREIELVDNEADFVILTDPKRRWANISLQLRTDPKPERNRLHLDLYSDDQQAEVERLIALGAGRLPWHYDEDDDFVVLADPDGNEFCVVDSSYTQD